MWRHSYQTKSISKTLESAQKRVEGFNFDSKNVVQYDNVINRHRKVVYGMRRKILEGEDIYSEIERLINTTVSDLCQFSSRVNKRFAENFQAIFPNLDTKIIKEIGLLRKEKDRNKLAKESIQKLYQQKEDEFSAEIMRKVEREVYLKVLDTLWMQHLENMQHLREGIHWRSVWQKNPLVEYRSESQKLFDGLERNLREQVLKIILTLTPQEAASTKLTDGEEYDTELTKMAESATEEAFTKSAKGDKNLDREFKKLPPSQAKGSRSQKKKRQRKNRKSGKKR